MADTRKKQSKRAKKKGTTRKRKDVMAHPAFKHGLYIDLNGIDGRTTIGRALNTTKKALRDWVGEGTPGSEILIQRAAYKHVKLSLLEKVSLFMKMCLE